MFPIVSSLFVIFFIKYIIVLYNEWVLLCANICSYYNLTYSSTSIPTIIYSNITIEIFVSTLSLYYPLCCIHVSIIFQLILFFYIIRRYSFIVCYPSINLFTIL